MDISKCGYLKTSKVVISNCDCDKNESGYFSKHHDQKVAVSNYDISGDL